MAQMKEVDFTSGLMGALIRGVTGTSASQIETMYKEFDTKFPQRQHVEPEFRRAFDALAPIFDERAPHVLPKRFRSSAWFYPLFSVALGLSDAGSDPKNDAQSGLPPTAPNNLHEADPASLATGLAEVDRLIGTKGQLGDDLADILRRQTTHKASRLQRIRLIRSVLV